MATQAERSVQNPITVAATDDEGKLGGWIQKLKSERKGKIEVLVTGKTGVGKSTLVNALVGRKVAEEGHGLKPMTKEVTRYSVTTEEGVVIIVWDSPGLQDGTDNEKEYLADMAAKCGSIDLILYCINSSAERSELGPGQRDFSAIQKFDDTFGHKLWENAVFVLTRGNTLENNLRDIDVPDIKQAFEKKMNEWEDEIQGALKSAHVPRNLAGDIPVAPAGLFKKPNLPGHKFWLSQLWRTAADRIKDSSRLDLIVLNEHRMIELSKITPDSFTKDGPQQPIVIDYDIKQGALISGGGGVGGAGVGAAVGAAAGAAVGSIVPGVGTAAAAAAGAVVGGAIGLIAGGVVGIIGGAGAYVLYRLWNKKKRPKKQD